MIPRITSAKLVGGAADGLYVTVNTSDELLRLEYYPPCDAIIGVSHPDSGPPIRRSVHLEYRRQYAERGDGTLTIEYVYVKRGDN